MFSAISLTISAGILYYILKYRVYVHVTINQSKSVDHRRHKTGNRAPGSRPGPVDAGRRAASRVDPLRDNGTGNNRPAAVAQMPSVPADPRIPEIVGALRNLKVKRELAESIARRACAETPDFDKALVRAIDYARKAA